MTKTNELPESKMFNVPIVSAITVYEYGAMSSKYKLEATNKLTAYATMILHDLHNGFVTRPNSFNILGNVFIK